METFLTQRKGWYEDGGWNEEATNQEMKAATTSSKQQGVESLLEFPQAAQLSQHLDSA